jgi:hypothetical protein
MRFSPDSLTLALVFMAVGGGAFAPPLSGQRADVNNWAALQRRIPSLEEEVEVKYRDASLHQMLGRAYISKFITEGRQAPQTLRTAFGEYLVSLELQSNASVAAEFEGLYKQFAPDGLSLQAFRQKAQTLLSVQQGNVLIVVDARTALDEAVANCGGFSAQRDVAMAAEGTRAHIHRIFLVASGREGLRDRASGNQVPLDAKAVARWDEGIRSYGFVGTDAGQVGDVFSSSFPPNARLIRDGAERGRFQVQRQPRRIVAGLKYFTCSK